MRLSSLVFIVFILLLIVGLWLDYQVALAQAPLFIAFHFASLAGVTLAVIYLWPELPGVLRKLILIIAALIIWRVSFFPIMVFAGWFATLGDWLILQSDWVPTVIYPSFLIVMAIMNFAVVVVGGLTVHYRRYTALPVLSIALVVAIMVSFTDRTDLRVLPDRSFSLSDVPPTYQASLGNPYYEAVQTSDYNVAEYVLVYSSAIMFSAIPSTPWSTTVKSVLEHEFRHMPQASSERRVIEHYLAFRSAHKWITCYGPCRDNWSVLLNNEAQKMSSLSQ